MVEATIKSRLAAMATLRSLRLSAVPHPSAQQSSVQPAVGAMALSNPLLMNLPSASTVPPLEKPPPILLPNSRVAPHQLPIKKRPLEGRYLACQPASQARPCVDEFGVQPPASERRKLERESSLGQPSTPDQWPPKIPKARNCEAMSVPDQPPQPQPRERQQAHRLQAASAAVPPRAAIESAVTAASILQRIPQAPMAGQPRTLQICEHLPLPAQLQEPRKGLEQTFPQPMLSPALRLTPAISMHVASPLCHASSVSSGWSARSSTCSFKVPLSPRSALQLQPQLLKQTSLQSSLRHMPGNHPTTYVASPLSRATGGCAWSFGRALPLFVGSPLPPDPQSSPRHKEPALATRPPPPAQLAQPPVSVLRDGQSQGMGELTLQQARVIDWVRTHPSAAQLRCVNPITTHVQHEQETPTAAAAAARDSTADTLIEIPADGLEVARVGESMEHQTENRNEDDAISEASGRMVGPPQASVPQVFPFYPEVGRGR